MSWFEDFNKQIDSVKEWGDFWENKIGEYLEKVDQIKEKGSKSNGSYILMQIGFAFGLLLSAVIGQFITEGALTVFLPITLPFLMMWIFAYIGKNGLTTWHRIENDLENLDQAIRRKERKIQYLPKDAPSGLRDKHWDELSKLEERRTVLSLRSSDKYYTPPLKEEDKIDLEKEKQKEEDRIDLEKEKQKEKVKLIK